MNLSDKSKMFAVVTIVALAVRIGHILVMANEDINPLFLHPIMDGYMHSEWARGVLSGQWPGSEPYFRAPLYIYFLSGLYAIFGPENRLLIQIAHALISALGAGFAALAAAHCFTRRAGWLTGFIFACMWPSIYFAGELLIATLITTLILLLVWLLLRGDTQDDIQPGGRQLFFVGLIWGFSAITRPNVLILAPVIVWYLFRERKLPWRSRGWLLLVVGLALPILPVTAHNLFKAHDTVFIASQGGVNFYIGNNHYSDGRTAYVPGTLPTWQGGYDDVIAMAKKETGREDLKPSGVDRHFLGKGISFWFQEPSRALKLYLHKLRLLFAMGERSNNKNIYFWRERSKVLRWPMWLGWTPILILAILGFFRRDLLISRRFLLLGFCLAYAFSIYLFFVNARFRLPVMALLTIPAGAGLDRIWEAWRAKRWLDPRRGLVVAAAALLFVTLPDLVKFTEDDIHADPFSWHTLGNGYNAAGKYFQARHAYQKAIDISKQYPQPHFYWIQASLYTKLADLFIRLDRSDEAIEVYTDYIREFPSDWEIRLLLGDLLLQTGRIDDAAAQFEVVLRNDPDNDSAKLGHAWILLHNGEAGAALRRFLELYRQHNSSQALFGAGMCQMELNQLDTAQKTFEQVLSLQSDYWQALGNLAVIYERSGQLGKAYDAYQQLLTINPRDVHAQQWLREHRR